jgi:hypothetical protein
MVVAILVFIVAVIYYIDCTLHLSDHLPDFYILRSLSVNRQILLLMSEEFKNTKGLIRKSVNRKKATK